MFNLERNKQNLVIERFRKTSPNWFAQQFYSYLVYRVTIFISYF